MRRLKLVCLLFVLAVTSHEARGQSALIDAPDFTGARLEVLKSLNTSRFDDDLLQVVAFASGHVSLDALGSTLIFEVPYIYLDESSSSSGRPVSGIGNPSAAIKSRADESGMFVEIGARLPLAPRSGFRAGSQIIDVHRQEAVSPAMLALFGLVNKLWEVDRLQFVLQGGPIMGFYSRGGWAYINLLSGFLIRYEGERISLGNAISGRATIPHEVGNNFPNRFFRALTEQIEFAASVRIGHFRPGLQVILPLRTPSPLAAAWGLSLRVEM